MRYSTLAFRRDSCINMGCDDITTLRGNDVKHQTNYSAGAAQIKAIGYVLNPEDIFLAEGSCRNVSPHSPEAFFKHLGNKTGQKSLYGKQQAPYAMRQHSGWLSYLESVHDAANSIFKSAPALC